MAKKNKLVSTEYEIPNQLDSFEHCIFIASWLDLAPKKKNSKNLSFHGVDLLSRKICPDTNLFFTLLSEILQKDFETVTMLGAEFIIPDSVVNKLISEKFSDKIISDKEQILNLWLVIAALETIEFINYLLKKIKSDPVCNIKALSIVNRLLLHYSTGQLWNLAYKSNQKVCELIVTENLTCNDYSDLLLDVLLDKALYYHERGWEPAPFKRLGFQCRQSDYSKFFFEKVLCISDDGFSLKPSLSTLEKLSSDLESLE